MRIYVSGGDPIVTETLHDGYNSVVLQTSMNGNVPEFVAIPTSIESAHIRFDTPYWDFDKHTWADAKTIHDDLVNAQVYTFYRVSCMPSQNGFPNTDEVYVHATPSGWVVCKQRTANMLHAKYFIGIHPKDIPACYHALFSAIAIDATRYRHFENILCDSVNALNIEEFTICGHQFASLGNLENISLEEVLRYGDDSSFGDGWMEAVELDDDRFSDPDLMIELQMVVRHEPTISDLTQWFYQLRMWLKCNPLHKAVVLYMAPEYETGNGTSCLGIVVYTIQPATGCYIVHNFICDTYDQELLLTGLAYHIKHQIDDDFYAVGTFYNPVGMLPEQLQFFLEHRNELALAIRILPNAGWRRTLHYLLPWHRAAGMLTY